jgi:hypothetical protein
MQANWRLGDGRTKNGIDRRKLPGLARLLESDEIGYAIAAHADYAD